MGMLIERSIVIDHTKVANTDQSNFPVLISGTFPYLATATNGGEVQSQNGYDIIFTSDAAGQNVLAHETEAYNPSTGAVSLWVRVPILWHSVDTTIYMWYGNAGVTESQDKPASVWDSGFMGVWHFSSGSALSTNDSSTNGNNGQNNGVVAGAGQIAGGASFNGASDVNVGNLGALPSQGTISFWMNAASIYSYPNAFSTGGGNDAIRFEEDSSGDFGVVIGNGTFNSYPYMAQSMKANTWYDVTLTWDASASIATGYLNGSEVFSTNSSNLWPGGIGDLVFGLGYGGGRYWDGLIDEGRLSSVVRSADWTATEFNNESSPSSFYNISPENAVVVGPGRTSLYGSQQQQFAVYESGGCSTDVNWSLSPANGNSGSITANGLFTAPNNIRAPSIVTVIATSQADQTKSGSSQVRLQPPPTNPILTLTANAQSPYVTGSTEQFSAKLTNQDGTVLPGATVTFNITGVNAGTGAVATDSNWNAIFSYTGATSGNDAIQAVATVSGVQVTSNTISATWLTPVQQISTTTVTGTFFLSDGSCIFDTPVWAKPAFLETFPTINFNPESLSLVPGNTSNVGGGTRPFTDITTDLNGNYTGTMIAQGNGYQAGVYTSTYSMGAFQAVFRGEFKIKNPGNVAIDFYNDDGFIFGVGNGATRVSGPTNNMPALTPFGQYAVMGAYNDGFAGNENQIVVNFPVAGTYPYEVDYTECDGGGLTLVMAQGATSPTGVPPTGSLALSPNSFSAQPVGGQTGPLTVQANDASGAPVPNLNVSLIVSGATNSTLMQTTDSSGQATFSYRDIVGRTDFVQAVANIDGLATYSNTDIIPWTLPPSTSGGSGGGGTLSISISAQNTVNLPSTLQLGGSVSDSGLQAGQTVTTTWSEVSGPGTVSFANSAQISTIASFTLPGTYVLQLKAVDPDASGSAQLSVTVNAQPGTTQGWIGRPQNGATVSGLVPITVAPSESLQSGKTGIEPILMRA